MNVMNLPHGGVLTERLVSADEVIRWRKQKKLSALWRLTPRQLCDLELIMNGGFSPLTGFMARADYEGVVARMRLQDGTLWPIPIVLDVSDALAEKLTIGDAIGLTDTDGALLAALEVHDLWQPDKQQEAVQVYQNNDAAHVGVAHLLTRTHRNYAGGTVFGLELSQHFDFPHLRHTPRQLRQRLVSFACSRVAAYPSRDPMYRAQIELVRNLANAVGARLLLHPAIGEAQAGDIEHYARVRSYEHLLRSDELLSILPFAPRMAGPREALLHAIVRKNYGCTHLIIDREFSSPGQEFYPAGAAQESVAQHEDELGIKMVPLPQYVDLPMSNRELPCRLPDQLSVPSWYSHSPIAHEEQGVTIFFTGLSGAGKSTIAKALLARLMAAGRRSVTLLDGDIVRQHLSSELGFSRAHRDLNILRIGFVASEITKHHGIAICAPIAPYAATRRQVRDMVEQCGAFIEVYVATPLAVCEARDRKGLYAKARAGLIKEFTGINDPYEVPVAPDIVIDTASCTPLEAADSVLRRLEQQGFHIHRQNITATYGSASPEFAI